MPLHYKFGLQTETLQLVPFMGNTCALVSVLVSITVKYGMIRSAPGEFAPDKTHQLSTTR